MMKNVVVLAATLIISYFLGETMEAVEKQPVTQAIQETQETQETQEIQETQSIEKIQEIHGTKVVQEIQGIVVNQAEQEETEYETENEEYTWEGPILNSVLGRIQGPSGEETYYNLDMSYVIELMQAKGYNYNYWVRNDGVKMYGQYVMCAANLNVRPKGTIVQTSLGTGIVCDGCEAATINTQQLDIAVTW